MTVDPSNQFELSGEQNYQNLRCMFCEKNFIRLTANDDISQSYSTHLSKCIILTIIHPLIESVDIF